MLKKAMKKSSGKRLALTGATVVPESVSTVPLEFAENAIYTADDAAKILHRSVKMVRSLCRMGRLAHQRDRKGYIISGWALRQYSEGRCVVNGAK